MSSTLPPGLWRQLTKKQKAAQLAVHERTLDRYRKAGRIKPPTIVNGITFWDADSRPTPDSEAVPDHTSHS